ncbi:MAG: copper resistance D family protein [Actinomycetota bacterium]
MHVDPLPTAIMVGIRFAVFAAQALLFGLALIIPFVARPAFAASEETSAEGRGRVSRRLARILFGALIVTLVGSGVVFYNQILIAGQVGGVDRLLDATNSVLASSFGQWYALRVALCGALALTLWGRVRSWALAGAGGHDARPPIRWWVGWSLLSLALIATISLSGHAAGADRPALAVTNDVVHLGAGAIWMSGIALLLFVLPVATASEPGDQLSVLAPAVDRFAPIAFGSIAIVAATGVFNSLLHVAAIEDLIGSGYGRALTVKLCGFLCILSLGALNHFVLRKRLVRARARKEPTSAPLALRRSVAIEVAVAVVILGATSTLVGLPPTKS